MPRESLSLSILISSGALNNLRLLPMSNSNVKEWLQLSTLSKNTCEIKKSIWFWFSGIRVLSFYIWKELQKCKALTFLLQYESNNGDLRNPLSTIRLAVHFHKLVMGVDLFEWEKCLRWNLATDTNNQLKVRCLAVTQIFVCS